MWKVSRHRCSITAVAVQRRAMTISYLSAVSTSCTTTTKSHKLISLISPSQTYTLPFFFDDHQRSNSAATRTTKTVSCRRFFSAQTAEDVRTKTSAAVLSSSLSSLSSSSFLPPLPTTSQPLGHPMPIDEHACSVSLPTWSSVVGYEEGRPDVTEAMLCGYPRFVYHPYIRQLIAEVVQRHGDDAANQDCVVLPSKQAAQRCLVFLQQAVAKRDSSALPDNALIGTTTTSTTITGDGSQFSLVEVIPNLLYSVIFPAETQAATAAKAYWQHTGEIVSSRRAQHALQKLGVPLSSTVTPQQYVCHAAFLRSDHHVQDDSSAPPSLLSMSNCPSNSAVQLELRQRIASWAHRGNSSGRCDETSVFLTPSGMGAIYLALRSARRRHYELYGSSMRGGSSVVYGFSYLDTLKLCSRPEFSPGGVQFFGKADAQDLKHLKAYLEQNPNGVSVLFTEVPNNPLLATPDLYALRDLANQYGFVLAVDDTISNFLNVDLLSTGLADVLCTSLTKLVSGRGDAIAGSCVVNPNTTAGQWMLEDLQQQKAASADANGLFCPDALALLRNSTDFVQRNQIINTTAEIMADWLVQHPNVERVYYPKHVPSKHLYDKLCISSASESSSPGYGGLMSIVLQPHVCQRTFYDALNVAKGPSLGTNFTLVCPYTLLAHYHELDFAMSYNVPPNLLRIAIGCLETAEQIQAKFEAAFDKSRLYPKLQR